MEDTAWLFSGVKWNVVWEGAGPGITAGSDWATLINVNEAPGGSSLCPPELQVLVEFHVWRCINNVLRCSEGWWWFDELGKSSAFLLLHHLFEESSGFLPLLPLLFPLVLMGCLWFWSWKHFLVTPGWFLTVVILQWFPNASSEVTSPSGASALLLWESPCVCSISVEELHAHCWATCSFLCFRTVHFYKNPFWFRN